MAARIPFFDQKKPRAVLLSDQAWEALSEDAILQGKTPNVICDTLIREYLLRPLEAAPVVAFLELEKKQHNLRLLDSLWKDLRLRALQEGRAASALMEQLLREYYGLPMPPPQLPD
jgi:hypothetical protein